jgi:hypothetical protein
MKSLDVWNNIMVTTKQKVSNNNNNDKKEKENTRYLFIQFGPTITYSGGESSSPFN